jgi:hypothetical protein
MARVGRWLACAIACAVVWGCSGDSADRDGDGTAHIGKPAGSGGRGGAAGDNPFGTPQMTKPAQAFDAGSAPDPNSGGTIEPISIDQCGADNPAALAPADVQALMAAGNAGGMRMLYPYDGTVFPRGLLAPALMWEGPAADAVYVHIKAQRFEYKGCLSPSAPNQVVLPQDVWAKAGDKTLGSGDPFLIEVSALSGGQASGPLAIHVTIAQATLKGSIYYNSYTSLLPGAPDPGAGMSLVGGGLPAVGGSVLRIPPGGTAERFVSTACNGCHSVSANGSRMLSQQMLIGGFSYALAPDTPPNPPPMVAGPRSSFGALYPDGSAFLAGSVVIEIARSALTQGLGAEVDAVLYRTDDGTVIGDTGIPPGALMPMFSPDGSLLVFNDYAAGEAHGLGLMKYDTAANKASEYRVLFMDGDPNMRPGWPFVLPDDQAVVFTRTDGVDFSGEGAGIAGLPVPGPISDLYIADVDTGTNTLLARAMGFASAADAASDDASTLPFKADDLHKNYFPTVSPVAAGGYFWVFFDSVRNYGNLGLQRQLWGAAIAIAPDGDYSVDRSAPAFYLPGQEFGTGNHRAFAALDPCKKDGDACTSGIDCCGGFCYVPEGQDDEFGTEHAGTCSSDVPMCSKTNERCRLDSDCCPPAPGEVANTCIAGFCAVVQGPD